MEVLLFEFIDFELNVRCSNVAAAYRKAETRQPNLSTATSYSLPVGTFLLLDFDRNVLIQSTGKYTRPVFFENKEYTFGFRFKDKSRIDNPYIHSKLRNVQDKFSYDDRLGFLYGTINFGNEIGKSHLTVRYLKDQQPQELTFGFEVFPTKLDYRNDYHQIVKDIETEYPKLAVDFLKKTYSSFQTGAGKTTDIVWWQVFGNLYGELIHASRYILSKPRPKLVKKSRFTDADRVKKWTSQMEEKFVQSRLLPETKYLSSFSTLTIDTIENRFFKHTLFESTRRFKKIKTVIERKFTDEITEGFRDELSRIETDLDALCGSPFFRSISRFRGIRQESLVLQKATGYSTILRCWTLLNRGLQFFDGLLKIELKNIADLYQIWCFLEIKKILQTVLDKDRPDDLNIARIYDDGFAVHLREGVTSRVSYSMKSGDQVELFHELSFIRGVNADTRSFTVNQRPDIVLRITKNDLRSDYGITYLYDAKYRLISDEQSNGPDLPPEESINQMHRYRDAIYFVDRNQDRPEKEVIGAYVLFPGRGSLEEVQNSAYFRSIEEVNIGAFPLTPNDVSNRSLLIEHLSSVLEFDTEDTLKRVSPQKKSAYEAVNPEVLIGIVPTELHAQCYLRLDSPFYYTGKSKPKFFGYSKLKYFAPYMIGVGISHYYEILRYEILPRSEIFQKDDALFDPNDKSERLVLRLGQRFSISHDEKAFKLSDGVIRHFRYSKLVNLRNPKNEKIEPLRVS
jgi:hypothetical protein